MMFFPKATLATAVLLGLALCGNAAEPRPLKVPSERDGKLVIVATEIAPGEVVPEKKKVIAKRWTLAILTTEKDVPAQDRVTVDDGEKGVIYRKWRPEDGFPSKNLRVGYYMQTYRQLSEGDLVKKGQLLAVVDTDLARDELSCKLAKIDAAESELQVATAGKEEANNRYSRMAKANITRPGTYSQEEEDGGLLVWKRYVQEELAKKANLIAAQREVNAALTVLKKHEIRAEVSGVIRMLNKQQGEAVKTLETVLEITPRDDDK